MTTEENSKSEALLDIPMLEQYLELVGPKLITDGLAVFEKMMPGYVSVLESNLTAQDKKGIVEEGHKIKGAAGSVGVTPSATAGSANSVSGPSCLGR